MTAARTLLQRYPSLEGSWPVKRLRAWREARDYRLHPRRMASWFRDASDMRTRLCISNLEMPEATERCRPTPLLVTLLNGEGQTVGSRRVTLARNGSVVLELGDLLPPQVRGHLETGQVWLDLEGPELGSSRAYFHWYNEHTLSSSHEKFGLTIPAVAGYWTVPNVQHNAAYRTYFAVVNLDAARYQSKIVLKGANDISAEASMELAPHGSTYVALDQVFADPGAVLGDGPGILYFENNTQPAMYYYFVANEQLGTWRVQHL